jgi:hypothetical protein
MNIFKKYLKYSSNKRFRNGARFGAGKTIPQYIKGCVDGKAHGKPARKLKSAGRERRLNKVQWLRMDKTQNKMF